MVIGATAFGTRSDPTSSRAAEQGEGRLALEVGENGSQEQRAGARFAPRLLLGRQNVRAAFFPQRCGLAAPRWRAGRRVGRRRPGF